MPSSGNLLFVISELSAVALTIKKNTDTWGYSTVPYYNPMDGIKQSIVHHPDFVIADFEFNSIMGLEVLQQIKIKYPDIRSILLVNDLSHPDVKKATELGCTVMKKPVDYNKLKEVLESGEQAGGGTVKAARNVMIVEKNPNNRFRMKKALGNCACEVTEVQNPFEFVEKYYLKTWDLILFNTDNDYMPPDEFLKVVREKKMDPSKFILFGIQWDRKKQDKFIQANFSTFQKIPINQDELTSIVQGVLNYEK